MRDHRFGEGDYEGSERLIRQLLAEAGGGVRSERSRLNPPGSKPPPIGTAYETRTYLGSNRSENLVSTDRVTSDGRRFFEAPAQLSLNHWALSGAWTIEGERAVLNEAVGRIAFQFEARDLHLVLGPPAEGTSATLPGAPRRAAARRLTPGSTSTPKATAASLGRASTS